MDEYIELLKSKILDLAMRGKLVEQDENDEPASVLIDRIIEEKHQLMKEGKIKKEKLSKIYKDSSNNHYYEKFDDGSIKDITDEIFDDIPTNWAYTRLHNIGEIVGGGTPKTDVTENWINATIPWLTPADMKNVNGIYVEKGSRNISEIGLKNSSAKIMPKGSILYSSRAPIGYIAIAKNDICTNQGFKSIILLEEKMNSFLYYELMKKTPEIISKASGTTFKEISGTNFGKIIVAIPPIKEQLKITSQLENLLKKIKDIIECNSNIQNYKSLLKEKILDLAIKGKLVEHNLNDESADTLINKIIEEKHKLMKEGNIKKENLSIIYKDTDNQFYEKFDNGKVVNISEEIPFELPSNWQWIKLKSIAFVTKLAGFEYTSDIFPNLSKEGIPLFKGKNVQNGKLILKFESFIPENISNKLSRSQLTKKCLLTPYVGTIGNIAIFEGNFKAHLGSNVGKIELYGNILEEYILYYFKSITGNNQLKKYKKSTAQDSISIDALRESYIALPPLVEQDKLVKKLDEIFNKL